jgi:hypothetical protein
MMRTGPAQPVFSGASISTLLSGVLPLPSHAGLLVDLLLVQTKRNSGYIFASSAYSLKRRIPYRQKPIITVPPLSSTPQVTVELF